MEKYILTGGPGVGKTTILNELGKSGEMTLSEAAREIIAEEQKKEPGILPWTNLAEFQKRTMQRQVQQEREAVQHKPTRIFQDRSLVDSIAYAEVGGINVPDGLYELVEQANYSRVFFLEQLPFYKQDKERKEDSELAQRIHQRLYQVYDRLGFDLVPVPVCNSIEERVQFVLREAHGERNREIERKYRVEHNQVKEMLSRYLVKHVGTDNEENTLYDFGNILKDLGCTFRIRQNNGEPILTLKGPTKSADFTNKPEYNFSIPKSVSTALDMLLPVAVTYSKRRENYRPLGDAKCTISFDYLLGVGEFVEIEAATENQVLLWEKRLGISEYLINKSYPALVKEHENANSG